MPPSAKAVAQAIFVRTDTPEYTEEIVSVRDLEELIHVCATVRPHCMLDRVVIISQEEPPEHELVLEFVSVSGPK